MILARGGLSLHKSKEYFAHGYARACALLKNSHNTTNRELMGMFGSLC